MRPGDWLNPAYTVADEALETARQRLHQLTTRLHGNGWLDDPQDEDLEELLDERAKAAQISPINRDAAQRWEEYKATLDRQIAELKRRQHS